MSELADGTIDMLPLYASGSTFCDVRRLRRRLHWLLAKGQEVVSPLPCGGGGAAAGTSYSFGRTRGTYLLLKTRYAASTVSGKL